MIFDLDAESIQDPTSPWVEGSQEPELVERPSTPASALDAHVAAIRDLYVRRSAQTWRDLGEYLLHHFYGGDVDSFRSRARRDLSLDALAARSDLGLARHTLHAAVNVAVQWRQLPTDLVTQLSPTQLRELAPVRDLAQRAEFARVAVEEQLSRLALRRLIQSARRTVGGDPPRKACGRQPQAPVVKLLNGLHGLLRELPGDAEEATVHLSPAELRRLAIVLRGRVGALEGLARDLDSLALRRAG